jgi:hypothetical protein
LNSEEDFSLFITIQHDAPANRLFAWGILLVCHSKAFIQCQLLERLRDEVAQTNDMKVSFDSFFYLLCVVTSHNLHVAVFFLKSISKMSLSKEKDMFFVFDVLEYNVESKHRIVASLKESFIRTLYAIFLTIHQVNSSFESLTVSSIVSFL